MNEKHRLAIGMLKLFDLAIIAFSLVVTTVILVKAEQSVPLALFFSVRNRVTNFWILIAALFICHILFKSAACIGRGGFPRGAP